MTQIRVVPPMVKISDPVKRYELFSRFLWQLNLCSKGMLILSRSEAKAITRRDTVAKFCRNCGQWHVHDKQQRKSKRLPQAEFEAKFAERRAFLAVGVEEIKKYSMEDAMRFAEITGAFPR